MVEIASRYINPYTNYGFKLLFGTEPNKDITLELVNALLQGKEVIKSLTLLPTEQLGDTKDDRRSVFDIYCENENGEKIIIEMQKADQQWFKDRSVYYSSFPIRQQGEKGQWRFGLKAVYTIGILDFVYFESEKVYYDNDGAIRTAEAKGIAKGREEGRAEGEQKKAFDIARNLLQMGMSSAQVSEVTGLTIEKIETL